MKPVAEAKMTHDFSGTTIRLRFRSDLHLARKAWHLIMGLVIVSCFIALNSQSIGLMILGGFLCFDLFLESIRLRNPALNGKLVRFWGPVLRSHEFNQMSTAPHYIASAMFAIAVFPKPVAILSILYLACGDPVASLFGILYGHRGPKFLNGKTWIGTFAGIIACTLVTFLYLRTFNVSDGEVILLSLVGGLAGGMAELLPFDIDDNFTIPIISGFVMWLAFMIAGL